MDQENSIVYGIMNRPPDQSIFGNSTIEAIKTLIKDLKEEVLY